MLLLTRPLLVASFLTACTHLSAPHASAPAVPWVETTIYRLNLADEAINERVLIPSDLLEAPDEWMARPEQAVSDGSEWLKQMQARAKIGDDALADVSSFSALKLLSLSECTLRDLSLLAKLPRLKSLAIAHVAFTPDRLRLRGTLEVLNATGSALASLAALPDTLRGLRMSGTHLESAELAELSRFHRLSVRKLYLSDTEIGDDDLPERAELPSLETLAVQ